LLKSQEEILVDGWKRNKAEKCLAGEMEVIGLGLDVVREEGVVEVLPCGWIESENSL
jgi:hypothetical protein